MITNVPSFEDFTQHGLMFLNLAWDSVFELELFFKYSEEVTEDATGEERECFWKAAKKNLAIAHALAQQGAELVLKAQITEVSPFLIISARPSEWPRGCDKNDASFAEFRTIDAQDLVRACNAVRSVSLPKRFVAMFDEFRKQRNALFHTVDKRLEFPKKEIILYILTIAHLIVPGKWPQIRKSHLEELPGQKTYNPDDVMNQLCDEMTCMIDLLGRSELQELFGFNKSQRRYICPKCYGNLNQDGDPSYPTTAQLCPNTAMSKNVHCFVCDNDLPVVRAKCPNVDCRGNVINAGDGGECLTCFEGRSA